jgi:hypothetical protein
MSGRDEESQRVIAAAQRLVKTGDSSKLDEFDLKALKKADYQIGNRDVNSGWRKAIQDAISSLENQAEIIEAKPGMFGFSLNLKSIYKKLRK